MYRGWPFFRTLVDFMQMTLAKSDLRIAHSYTYLVRDEGVRDRMWARISAEHAACVDALLLVTDSEKLLDDTPVLQRSIRLRNPYVDPLSYVQVSLLRRLRDLPEDFPGTRGRPEDPAADGLGDLLGPPQHGLNDQGLALDGNLPAGCL